MPRPARALALQALRRWRTSREFADVIVQRSLSRSQLSAPDRAFAQELFYGVLRNLTVLDFWIDCLRRGKLEADLQDILRLGLYQLFLLGAAEHAAVYETVELGKNRQRALINGILREALRQRDNLSGRAQAQPAAVQFSHPPFLLERWEKEFGQKDAVALCHWNNRPAPLYARINRLKIQAPDFLAACGGSFVLPHHDSFVGLPSVPVEALARGYCYIQDPSTSMACRLLDPRSGERILDACAAPGGKTGYLAELMENDGDIVACDRNRERVDLLRSNVQRLGVANVEVIQHDWRRGGISASPFDKILLDAPCTNTGVMRRRVDLRWRLRPDDFARMGQQQISIVRALVPLLKSGGVFVYSTCSLEREENEEVIELITNEFRHLELEATRCLLPPRDGFDGAFTARFISR